MKNAGLTFIPTNKPNVMAFELNGVVTEKELPSELEKFSAFLQQYEKVRMLARFTHFGGFEPAVLLHSGGFISVKLAAVKKVERYAVVGAPEWMTKLLGTMGMFFPAMEIRSFSKDDESNAWQWLEAKAA